MSGGNAIVTLLVGIGLAATGMPFWAFSLSIPFVVAFLLIVLND